MEKRRGKVFKGAFISKNNIIAGRCRFSCKKMINNELIGHPLHIFSGFRTFGLSSTIFPKPKKYLKWKEFSSNDLSVVEETKRERE
jgi:hypothetical protein